MSEPSTTERSLMECGRNREKLWAVHSAHRIDHYLVEQDDRTWKYNLLWSALSKFDRICRKGGQA
jgi:hypothetical protein